MYDFYNMLSVDNPCYEDRQSRRAKKESLAGPSETIKSLRHETIKSLRHELPQAEVPTRTDPGKGTPPQGMPAKRNANPSFNPFIYASVQPQRHDVITFKYSSDITKL